MAAQQIEVKLPHTLDHQKPWVDSDARQKVIVAGRRCGKSKAGLICVVLGHGPTMPDGGPKYRGALYGKRLWWVTRDFGTSWEIWQDLKNAVKDMPYVKVMEQQMRIIFSVTGGEITIKSMDSRSLRGSGLDGMVLDEAAYFKEGVWEADLRAALSDKQGWSIFITTPNGGNWFYDHWQKAQKGEAHGRSVKTFSAPTSANPKIPDEEVEEARLDLHPLIFAQEYLAEFIVAKGDVFKKEWFSYYEIPDDVPDAPGAMDLIILTPHNAPERIALQGEGVRFITADLATSLEETADHTAIGVWQHTRQGDLILLHLEWLRIEGPDIPDRIQDLMREWNCAFAGVEQTGHKSIVQHMIRMGIPVRAFTPGRGDDKRTRAIPAAARMRVGKVFFRKGEATTELAEMELTRFTGAKEGEQDDIVDMIAYAEHVRAVHLSGGVPLVGGR